MNPFFKKLIFLVFLILLIAGIVWIYQSAEQAGATWYDDSWTHRKKLTFNNASQAENLANFPTLIKLTSSNFTFSEVQSDGDDLRFTDTDGSTVLYYDIETWSVASQTAVIWVNVPQIDASSALDYIYLYWGNSGAAAGEDANNTWESNYKGVYHLNENSTGTAVLDSSGNSNDLTSTGNTSTFAATGQIGNGFIGPGMPNNIQTPAGTYIEYYPSVQLDANNNPVIAYEDGTNIDLVVVHCNDPDCKGNDESVQVVDTSGSTGIYPSLQLDTSGYPVIAYFNDTNDDLIVTHCNDANCAGGDESIQIVDSTNATGYYPMLLLDTAGYPVIAYYYSTGADLKLVHCNDANCAGGDEATNTVDSTGTLANYLHGISIHLDTSGYPVISYFDDTNDKLKVAHCNDANCSGGDESIVTPTPAVAQLYGYGFYNTMDLDASGYPMIAYYETTSADLFYMHCDDVNCAGTETNTSISGSGAYPWMALNANGYPVIAYTYNAYPRISFCANANCTSDTEYYLSSVYNNYPYYYPTMVMDSNFYPVIVYYGTARQGTYDIVLYRFSPKVRRAYDADFNFGTGSFTVSLWAKSNGWVSYNNILSRYDNDQGFRVYTDYGGHPCFAIDDDTSWTPDDAACAQPYLTNRNIEGAGSVYENSLRLDTSGYPVVSFRDANDDLRLVRCNDVNCAGGNETVTTIENTNAVGYWSAMQLDTSDYPVIAHFDETNDDLRFVHCGDANCSSGNSAGALATTGNVGRYPSLELDDSGYPVIGYYDATNTSVKLIHCNDTNCTGGDEAINTVDNAEADGPYLSTTWLKLDINDYPVMAYFDDTNDDLKITHCNDVNCADSNETTTRVESSGGLGQYASMELDGNGYPVIAFYYADYKLKLIHCQDANCTTKTSNFVKVDSNDAPTGIYYFDLELTTAGNPVILHTTYAFGFATLITYCNDPNCAGDDETTHKIGGQSNYNYVYCSLELDAAGYPVIATGGNAAAELWLTHGTSAVYRNTSDISDSTWHHIVGVKNTTSSLKLYIDGVEAGSDVAITGTTLTSNSAPLRFLDGTYNYTNAESSMDAWRGYLDEVQIIGTNRSAAWVAAQYLSESDNFVTYASGAETPPDTAGADPIAWWKMDEGYGTIAYDAAGSSDGTVTGGVTWKSADECKSGQCLYFDGDGDYVDTNFQGLATGDNFTISYWLRTQQIGTSGYYSFAAYDGADYIYTGRLNNGVLNYLEFIVYDGATPVGVRFNDSRWRDNNWHYLSFVKSGNTQADMKIYMDGVDTSAIVGWSGTLTNHTIGQDFFIGATNNNGSPGGYFTGFVDDIKVYDYARSATQIQNDYTGPGTPRGSSGRSVTVGEQRDPVEGLVAYWKMDEASWNGTPNEVVDFSGNSNHGTSYSGASTTATAKFGMAGNFDGSNDYVNAGSNASLRVESGSFTLESWIKPAANIATDSRYTVMAFYSTGWLVDLPDDTGNEGYRFYNGATAYKYSPPSGLISLNWTHYVVVRDAGLNKVYIYLDGVLKQTFDVTTVTTSANPLLIGKRTDGYSFNGQIDDVKIYKTARSASQIRRDYESGPGPVAQWKMDEDAGDTAYDTSGNANNGDLYGACPGAATCPTWSQGKYGNALKFDGTDDYVDAGSGTSLNMARAITIGAWVKLSQAISAQTQYAGIVANGDGSTDPYMLYVRNDLGIRMWINDNSALVPTASLSVNNWHHIEGTYDGANIRIYLNGVLQNTTAYTTAIGTSTNLYFGKRYAGSTFFNGSIDDVRIYNYARTPKQIMEDMNAGHPAVGSPVGSYVGYWKLDEGYGQTAFDKSVNNNDGTLGASSTVESDDPTWTTAGKYGNALSFGGSGDYVNLGTGASLNPGYNSWTISAWVFAEDYTYPKSLLPIGSYATSPNDCLSTGAGYSASGLAGIFFGDGSTRVSGTINCDAGYRPADIQNTWAHIVVVFDRAVGSAYAYVNGVKQTGSVDISSVTGSVDVPHNRLSNVGGWYLDGKLDEVKFYPFVLTADDVKQEYNGASSLKLGVRSTESDGITASNSDARSYCVPGDTTSCDAPVAQWKMDERDGQWAYDTSGANDGTRGATNTAGTDDPTWLGKAYCHEGACLQFDGTDDYVSFSSLTSYSSSQAHSYAAWVRHNGGTQGYRWLLNNGSNGNGTSLILYYSSGYHVTLFTNGGANFAYDSAQTIPANEWHYIVATYDGLGSSGVKFYVDGKLGTTGWYSAFSAWSAGNTSPRIGSWYEGSYDFLGNVDDVRVYNYARTQAQIAWDYNRGQPVARWDMNEGQDTSTTCNATTATVYDKIGSNDGTLSLTPAGNTDFATARVEGKYGCAINFDGTDDYVDAGAGASLNLTSNFTVSAWGKPTAVVSGQYLIAKRAEAVNGYNIYFYGVGGQIIQVVDGGGSQISSDFTWDLDQWQHIVLVVDAAGTSYTMYKNGVAGSAKSITAFPNNLSQKLYISSRSAGYLPFTGPIDDVRVYNYALTAKQIEILYNEGSGVRFGPNEGLP